MVFLFWGLIKKGDQSVSICQKNLQIVATEIYETKNYLEPELWKIFSTLYKLYNLKSGPELQRQKNRRVHFRTDSISSLAWRIWELIPSDIRHTSSLEIPKEIKFRTTAKCICRLCKTLIGNVGFNWKCSKKIIHKTCGATLSSFFNVILYIFNLLRWILTNNTFATMMQIQLRVNLIFWFAEVFRRF